MAAALLTLFGPASALVLIGLIPALRRSGRPAALVSIAGIGAAAGAAAAQAIPFLTGVAAARSYDFVWAPLARVAGIHFGLLIDGLSASMALLVALVALLVQIYSWAYMSDETPASLGRYYAYHSLFAFAMLGLVLAHNLLQTYVFWELVGFALGVLVLWGSAGTFTFSDLFAKSQSGALGGSVLALGLAGVYLGAMGKS